MPEWTLLLDYFLSKRSTFRRPRGSHPDGLFNLQDLYLFVTRVALPNVIIHN
ncbi:hypothetical protein K504DRAFT_459609 [Pleomassaria siparia CBS 279.74]|uniref:Uncharacterized protein n=1 Tax=Pleomassaria siparia CBS 279.74 TaxID=1314801 RepID=A0A6G1K132_9PLEO|nr:hypothetical protein K504DRAFT_459609 [Pleomassaria siparia CBS 279.74]